MISDDRIECAPIIDVQHKGVFKSKHSQPTSYDEKVLKVSLFLRQGKYSLLFSLEEQRLGVP